MSTAELRARQIFKECHLNNENFEVKRNLMILLLTPTERTEETFEHQTQACHQMSHADVSARLAAAEKDILSGNVMACEDVHRNIEEKCPWL